MPLADLSFKIYTDSSLTSLFDGTLEVVNETDLSDNPQDFGPYYLGSAEAAGTRTLQANSNPGIDNITLTPTYILDQWVAATAYIAGNMIEPVTPNGFKYVCVTSGTSHATTEPTWPTTSGSQVTDNTAVWECVGATHPNTEIKLATTSGGLAGATGGAALTVGTSVLSGTANKFTFYVRITNTNTYVNDNTGYPELGININEVIETS